MLKRKGNHDADFVLLEGQVKRCKISLSPGELRLTKDIDDIEKSPALRDFVIERTPQCNVVRLLFQRQAPSQPCAFLVEVPKYYPHDKPTVLCVDAAPSVQVELGDWRATHSLRTVISVLVNAREIAVAAALSSSAAAEDMVV